MYSRERPEVPDHTTFINHFGNKAGLDAALARWVCGQDEFQDLVVMLPPPTESPPVEAAGVRTEGLVYLLKSGGHYKIGRSQELERRVKEIRTAMPEEVSLVHSIRTDDPAGIEAYWHNRFKERRVNGEWFRLNAADVRAFKRRKFHEGWGGVPTHTRWKRFIDPSPSLGALVVNETGAEAQRSVRESVCCHGRPSPTMTSPHAMPR